MADLTFKCPHCQNDLSVDESGAGMTVDCPECNRKLNIPSPAKITTAKRGSIVQCPNCGSSNTVRASAVHQQGTSHISGQQTQYGGVMMMGTDGEMGFGPLSTRSSYKGIQQTTIARRLSPPIEPEGTNRGMWYLVGGIILAVFMLVFIMLAAAFTSIVLWLLFCAGITSIIYALIKIPKEKAGNEAVQISYRRALSHWSTLWYCQSCGESFQPK